jgi:hypothetical protein
MMMAGFLRPFFFTTQPNMFHAGIPLERLDKIEAIDVRKAGDRSTPAFFNTFENG